MSSNLRDPRTATGDQASTSGLSPDELQAEQAGELPERDAMSVIGVGGITGGLPPDDIFDCFPEADPSINTRPVGGLPDQSPLPAIGLPVGLPVGPPEGLPEVPPADSLPSLDAVDERIDNLPVDTLLDGNLTDAPEVAADADATVKV